MSDFDVEQFCTKRTNQWRKHVWEHRARTEKVEMTPYETELYCFGLATFGSDALYEMCLNCFRFQWGDAIQLVSQGIENYWLKRTIKAFTKFKKLNLMGCASSGKTFGASAWAYTRWKSSPWNTSVYLSTTSAEAGEARTWGEIKNLHSIDRQPVGVRIEYRHMIVLQEESGVKDRDYRDSITCVCIKEGSEGHQAVKTISGRKNENVIWVCDEQPHMNIDILEARPNLRANPFSQFAGIGNKPEEGDPLYIDAEPYGDEYPDGWKSVNPSMRGWPTRGGWCIYFDGEKSPNLLGKDPKNPPFPRLITAEMIATISEETGGTDSGGYWRQVRGFPSTGDLQDTVLTGELIRDRKAHEQPLWGTVSPQCVAGLDLGFREDGDPCVADFAKLGRAADGQMILGHEKDGVKLTPAVSDPAPFEDKVARCFLYECGATIDGKTSPANRNCNHVAVDISGDGGIIAQAIVRIAREVRWTLELHSVSFSGAPDENAQYTVGGRRRKAKEMFDRRVSEIWYSFRLDVQAGIVRGLVPESKAVKELCARKVLTDERKRFVVESKRLMKKRIRKSPDFGDARVLAAVMARKLGFAPSVKVEKPMDAAKEWQKALGKKPEEQRRYASRYPQRRMYAGR